MSSNASVQFIRKIVDDENSIDMSSKKNEDSLGGSTYQITSSSPNKNELRSTEKKVDGEMLLDLPTNNNF